jgi:hypothetical protein
MMRGLMPDENKCPSCGKEMKLIGAEHAHCDCGVCINRGVQYIWFRKTDQVEEPLVVRRPRCPDKSWARDEFLKTGKLS